MEKYVVTRELAIQLKDANFPQNTEFCWFPADGQHFVMKNQGSKKAPAAPISDEILEQLRLLDIERKTYTVRIVKSTAGLGYSVCYWHRNITPKSDQEDYFGIQNGATLADALAKLWIWVNNTNL